MRNIHEIIIIALTLTFIRCGLFSAHAETVNQPISMNEQEGPAWKLCYARQWGYYLTSGVAGQAELMATHENGSNADIGMTNDANAHFAIFGTTGVKPEDPYTPGTLRVTFDINNDFYDFHVFDPTTPSDSSPVCYWLEGLPNHGHYRFEFWWRRVEHNEDYIFYPNTSVYHYDQVSGFNTLSQEPAKYKTDAFSLTDWVSAHHQTFVVPAGINRIIGAKAFAVRRPGEKFEMTFSIHEGRPGGPQVGPSVTSREIQSNEFPNVFVTWGMEDVPVTPGATYAMRVGTEYGFNMYATDNDTYADGELYNHTTKLPERDMIAVIVGARKIIRSSIPDKYWTFY